jgi:sugar (pentulose or hexulose) kinase
MYFLGLDIGTTGAKALLIDENGTVVRKGYRGYPLISDGVKIEQNADDWITSGSTAIREALGDCPSKQIAAISLSTQGASTVAVARDGKPLCNAYTWMDGRSQAEAEELARALGEDFIYHHTGWRVTPTLDAAKIMHMKRTLAADGPIQFLSTLEYVNLFLTGRAICDPSNACARQLYNIAENAYDRDVLSAVGIQNGELADVSATGTFVGGVTRQAAQKTGLAEGTPVYNGAHDQYCATIGAGAIRPGDMLVSAGTTWVVMGVSDRPVFSDSFIAPGVHPVEGLYGNIASLIGSGSSMQWFKNNFTSESFGEIDLQAAARMEKTRNLFFFPYPAGATYPIWNLKARAAFTGIALEHDRFDFARAVMEGVSFNVRRTLADFRKNGFPARRLRIMGGASKSPFWCSVLAAAANMELSITNEPDACAIGAAAIAAVGCGAYPSYEAAIRQMASPATPLEPDAALAEELERKFKEYDRMWANLSRFYA